MKLEFRILRVFETVKEPQGAFGPPAIDVKKQVSQTLQHRVVTNDPMVSTDWIDVPVVDFDNDTGEYIEAKN
ncbi:hypothetical protein A3765_28565 [Oleiphilus sp. HI0130]|nr:hypothetical protein A3765_28850 [Oleiphilus sp. HI0130]KZZ72506.1 hypothetical protein A3765_28565 [Oleiphilus sp. HI0130]